MKKQNLGAIKLDPRFMEQINSHKFGRCVFNALDSYLSSGRRLSDLPWFTGPKGAGAEKKAA